MAIIAGVVLIAGVGIYYMFTLANSAQKKFNEARAKDSTDLGGGEVGHIAELYQVLDQTERMSVRGADEERQARKGRGARSDAAPADPPVIPAKWTMDAAAVQIPNGPVAGTFSGSNFVANDVVLYTGTATPILALRQGGGRSGERELLIYLRLKPGEQMEGRTWTVTREQATGAPQLVKRLKTPDGRAPQQQNVTGGYLMKLEFGKVSAGGLPGKISLALPDPEQSAVGGLFTADIRVLSTAQNQGQPGGRPSLSFDE